MISMHDFPYASLDVMRIDMPSDHLYGSLLLSLRLSQIDTSSRKTVIR